METSLRLVLILIAILIILGIVWDTIRSRGKRAFKRKSRPLVKTEVIHFNHSDAHSEFDLNEEPDELPEEGIIIVKKEPEVPLEPLEISSEPFMVEEQDTYLNRDPNSIIVLNVLARQPGVFSGKKLLDVFQDAHLFFGDMDIFHRHEHTDGTGKIIFSVVSAVEPGIFNAGRMDTFVTPGLTLFFSSVRPNQSIAAFELMLRTAKLIALRLDGEVKDQERRTLTLQGIEKYRERIRNTCPFKKASKA